MLNVSLVCLWYEVVVSNEYINDLQIIENSIISPLLYSVTFLAIQRLCIYGWFPGLLLHWYVFLFLLQYHATLLFIAL